MGQVVIADMRSEVESALGNRGIASPRVDRWLNFAYFEIIGAVEFAELLDVSPVVTVADTETVSLLNSGKILTIRGVWDTTNKKRYRFTSLDNFLMLDKDRGIPRYWTRRGALLAFRPIPKGVFKLDIALVAEPPLLSDSETTTKIPTTWDFPLVTMAEAMGFFALNEENRGWQFWNRAVASIRSRALYEERFFDSAALGVSPVDTEEDVVGERF